MPEYHLKSQLASCTARKLEKVECQKPQYFLSRAQSWDGFTPRPELTNLGGALSWRLSAKNIRAKAPTAREASFEGWRARCLLAQDAVRGRPDLRIANAMAVGGW